MFNTFEVCSLRIYEGMYIFTIDVFKKCGFMSAFTMNAKFLKNSAALRKYSPYAKVLVKMSVRHLRNTTLQHKFIYYTTTTTQILFKIKLRSL